MIDREKAIKGLECCISGQSCKGCPYKEQGECEYSGYHFKAIRDALALLKEQEAVEPDVDSERTCSCGNCGETVGWYPIGSKTPVKFGNFCPECGKKVKWE